MSNRIDAERGEQDMPSPLVARVRGKPAHLYNVPRIAAGRGNYLGHEIVQVKRVEFELPREHIEEPQRIAWSKRRKRNSLTRVPKETAKKSQVPRPAQRQ